MSSATTNSLLVRSDKNGITHLWLNRPERRHALSLELLQEMERVLNDIGEDKTVRVVILGSSGKVFSSGHDLGEMRGRSPEDYETLFSTCSRVMQKIRQLPQPVIARVQGFATAAGCQLVAACDLAVAAQEASFATPGVKIGLFCTTPMVPLVRNIAPKKAMEMLLTGQPLSADEACRAGLVNQVVPAEELDQAIDRLAQAIVSSSPLTIAIGKRAFYEQLSLDEPSAYSCAVDVMVDNAMKSDAQEGISAFLEKRSPQWKGE
jgi:enoyl-CoA hydratase/carnithine racemase